ncbi:alpha/beta hydrolase [Streptococcus troglodytae]
MMKKTVMIKHGYYNLTGLLFLPENVDDSQTYPAIVISAPAGAVKEQSPSFYAERLAARGLISLVFDTSFQGESGGEPRYVENPYVRVEDVKCAVDYLTSLSYIDSERIGALGICSGGGYVINAAMTDRRIKAVAGVSISDPGSWIRDGLEHEITLEAQLALLEEASKQRTAEANGSAALYGPYVPEETSPEMPRTLIEAHDYYRTPRGAHPRSVNKVSLLSVDKLLTFDTFRFIDSFLTQPILLVAGTKADTINYSKEVIEKAASRDKELYKISGASHVDLYDKKGYVDPAVDKIFAFFSKKL